MGENALTAIRNIFDRLLERFEYAHRGDDTINMINTSLSFMMNQYGPNKRPPIVVVEPVDKPMQCNHSQPFATNKSTAIMQIACQSE